MDNHSHKPLIIRVNIMHATKPSNIDRISWLTYLDRPKQPLCKVTSHQSSSATLYLQPPKKKGQQKPVHKITMTMKSIKAKWQ